MKQNKKMIVWTGSILTIICMIAAVVIGWNHLTKISQATKDKKQIGYYQWDSSKMDSFIDVNKFTYQEEQYETIQKGGDGVLSYYYPEFSMKGRKPIFWLKETMSQKDKAIAKTILWWKGQLQPVYALQSESGCQIVFLNTNDDIQMIFWKKKDRNKLKAYYTDFDHYNFTITDSTTNKKTKLSSKEAKKYAKLEQIRKNAKNVKEKYTIHGESKDHIVTLDFDIMTVGDKLYLGKEANW